MGKTIENAGQSTLLLKDNEGDGYAVFKTCPKCGAVWKSNKHSKSCLCKRCAILESLERVRRKKGKIIVCPYCGEKFISIHEAKHCSKQKCKYKHVVSLALRKWGMRKCERCGKEFSPKDKNQRFCCMSCASRSNATSKSLGEKIHRQRVEECLAHIRMCKTKGELKSRFPSDYNFCHRHHLPEYFKLQKIVVMKYSDEEIYKIASRYQYKTDFRKEEPNVYATASRRGLIPKLNLKTSPHLFDTINYVYRYLFVEHNAVYVGRTKQPRERDYDHRRNRRNHSVVFKFALEHGIEIPKMEVLESGLSGEESQNIEDRYVRQYGEEGFLVLNKGATGVGTGSMGMKRRYSEKSFMKVARTYKSYSKFKEENPRLFHAGERYGWLVKCGWLQHDVRLKNTLTKEYCFNVARKYGSRSELNDADSSVYNKMLKCGWLGLCAWFPERRNLTYDYCMSVARRCSCAKELYRRYGSVSSTMYKKGWIKDCTWFKTPGPPESHMRKIKQFTKDGVFVASFRSVVDAARATGSNASKITDVCRGRRLWTNGFVWKYA